MLDVQAVPMMFITSSQSVANIHSYRKQQLVKGIYKIHFYQFHDLLSFFHDTKLPYDRKSPIKIKFNLQGCKLSAVYYSTSKRNSSVGVRRYKNDKKCCILMHRLDCEHTKRTRCQKMVKSAAASRPVSTFIAWQNLNHN